MSSPRMRMRTCLEPNRESKTLLNHIPMATGAPRWAAVVVATVHAATLPHGSTASPRHRNNCDGHEARCEVVFLGPTTAAPATVSASTAPWHSARGQKSTTQHGKNFARAAQGPPDRARAHSSCHESVGQSVMSRSGGSDDPCRRTGKAERANFECNFVMIGRHLAHRIIIKLPITERSHPAHRSRVCVHRRRHLCAVLWLCVRVRDTLERDRRESGTSVPGVAPCAPWRCPARAGWRKGPSFSHVGRLNQ